VSACFAVCVACGCQLAASTESHKARPQPALSHALRPVLPRGGYTTLRPATLEQLACQSPMSVQLPALPQTRRPHLLQRAAKRFKFTSSCAAGTRKASALEAEQGGQAHLLAPVNECASKLAVKSWTAQSQAICTRATHIQARQQENHSIMLAVL
jgi:hypothetical protein